MNTKRAPNNAIITPARFSKLSFLFRVDNPYLNIDKLRGIRNRVAHDYESVIIDILLDAIEKDLPELKSKLLSALDSNNK